VVPIQVKRDTYISQVIHFKENTLQEHLNLGREIVRMNGIQVKEEGIPDIMGGIKGIVKELIHGIKEKVKMGKGEIQIKVELEVSQSKLDILFQV